MSESSVFQCYMVPESLVHPVPRSSAGVSDGAVVGGRFRRGGVAAPALLFRDPPGKYPNLKESKFMLKILIFADVIGESPLPVPTSSLEG